MYRWSEFSINRFYGLDLKNNVIDVQDGFSIDCDNVYQNGTGVCAKRPGHQVIFSNDESNSSRIDEIGSCTINNTKYYFKFVDGVFKYSTTISGNTTTINPTTLTPSQSAIESDTSGIWWAVLDNKLFFVDGVNKLRYFDGSTIKISSIYNRPDQPLNGGAGAGFDYTYTVDNGLGESPACSSDLINHGSAQTLTLDLTNNPGSDNILEGYVIRIYSKSTSIAAAYILVATYTITASDVTAGNASIVTSAIADEAQLYTELGAAVNKTAPTGLDGITVHYGRLVGWKESFVYNSKSSNPHSWPDDSAIKESFVYSFADGDGESITRCISYQESLYVMKDTKINIFVGIGPDDTGNNSYALRRLETNGIGCVAGKSVQVIGDDQNSNNYLIFLANDGFYATAGATPYRIGERIETQIQPTSKTQKRFSTSIFDKKLGFYECYVGSDISNNGWILDVKKDNGEVVGWFKFSDINPTCIFWDEDRYIYGNKSGICAAQRNSSSTVDYSDVKFEYISTSDINTTSNQISIDNTYSTGDEIIIRTNGTIPAGITANTTYYIISVNTSTIKLATSLANANLGTAIDITTTGSGTHSLIAKEAISAYYTTNWIKFKSASHVKKLGKLMIIFDATATSVSMTMSSAYDWTNDFQDTQTISINSSNLWGDSLWGIFVWGSSVIAKPKNIAIARRKTRSVRYKFMNNDLEKDFNLKGIEQQFAYIRNRGEFA